MLIVFHKPYGILSQFTPDGSNNGTLSTFGFPRDVYSIGRLDADSEGLLLLSDESCWNTRLLEPSRHVQKTYWALVERKPTEAALSALRNGVSLDGKTTLPAEVRLLDRQPDIVPRVPPLRIRKTVQDYWLELKLVEGRNRQVRRMTASVGNPTIRLLRVGMGPIELGGMLAGSWRNATQSERENLQRLLPVVE